MERKHNYTKLEMRMGKIIIDTEGIKRALRRWFTYLCVNKSVNTLLLIRKM